MEITPNKWQRAKAVFDAALQRPTEERASFLVESGERWAELESVHLAGTIELIEDEELQKRIEQAMDEKYAAFRTPRSEMSDATRTAYSDYAFLRLTPEPRMLTWDNRRA